MASKSDVRRGRTTYRADAGDDASPVERRRILLEHIVWLNTRDPAEYQRDFSNAPITKWLAMNKGVLSSRQSRRTGPPKYRPVVKKRS